MLELRYAVEPDEYNTINGMELAAQLIQHAAGLLVPYVANCPACLDTMFSKIANDVLADIHADMKAGNSPGFSYIFGLEGDERDAALQSHLEANRETVVALLVDGEDTHRH